MIDNLRYSVWLYDEKIGWLFCHDNYTWFEFTDNYLSQADRPVLGLRFEENLRSRFAANLRLPHWFSNLLPEGILRDWIASERSVSREREMELLAQVGHDLPGAVRILLDNSSEPYDGAFLVDSGEIGKQKVVDEHQPWKFSLAGVGLKFSMLRAGERFSCTATGEGGDWILKLPDSRFSSVPLNEFSMMRFARAVGIEVPEVELVHRDQIDGLPAYVWPRDEEMAYAIRRFDRGGDRRLVHIEDFAQIRGIYPTQKYEGNFETIAALAYRGHDIDALHEFVRRFIFFVLIGNGDAHLKNWSLIYRDQRVPTLSPAYDIVSTEPYDVGEAPEDLGLKFAGDRRFESVRIRPFERLARRLGAESDLGAVAYETVQRVVAEWPQFADELTSVPLILDSVGSAIAQRSRTLTRGN